jgi:hypothetical protein
MNDQHCIFENLELLNREDEGRFELPPREARERIEVGQYAELAYLDDRGVELLWAEVQQRSDDAGYWGRLDSRPASASLRSLQFTEGSPVQFWPRHVHDIYERQAVAPGASYADLLADAQRLRAAKHWAPVLAIEDAEISKLVPASIQGAHLQDYLRRNPWCASCDARGLRAEAELAVYLGAPAQGDGDDNLQPLCRISAYVLVARRNGWPVRGGDVSGHPSDPDHPWNAER